MSQVSRAVILHGRMNRLRDDADNCENILDDVVAGLTDDELARYLEATE